MSNKDPKQKMTTTSPSPPSRAWERAEEGQKRIKALIFDLDGVLTQTQGIHKAAWKELFDDYLTAVKGDKVDRRPVTDNDYNVYIDGKPRYEGVKSFLQSRNVFLDYGSPQDDADKDTICGLGNRKNKIFNKHIDEGGFEVYEDAVNKLKEWRALGFKTAIVSSSKNCLKIINKAGIANLFDTRVDGLISQERNLQGKPHPDIFLEAAHEIDVKPAESVVFEDAISGVLAGYRGDFGVVAGVSRFGNRNALLENGADIAVDDFNGFDLFNNPEIDAVLNPPKPAVFKEGREMFTLLEKKEPVFFLDYDGTLTPIVNKPEDAVISEGMRQKLKDLAQVFTTAIVTGRDTKDVQNFIRLDNLIYAGSHGYNITGPNNLYKEHEKAEEIVDGLDEIEKQLEAELPAKTEGVQVERKRYAIAVHYRNAGEKDVPVVYETVEKMLGKYNKFRKGEGKMVVEIKPDLDWHKGKAVGWILEALGLTDFEKYLPVYIGDDITDEDAFRALKGIGYGILVGNHGQNTDADYTLRNLFEVKEFFDKALQAGAK